MTLWGEERSKEGVGELEMGTLGEKIMRGLGAARSAIYCSVDDQEAAGSNSSALQQHEALGEYGSFSDLRAAMFSLSQANSRSSVLNTTAKCWNMKIVYQGECSTSCCMLELCVTLCYINNKIIPSIIIT